MIFIYSKEKSERALAVVFDDIVSCVKGVGYVYGIKKRNIQAILASFSRGSADTRAHWREV